MPLYGGKGAIKLIFPFFKAAKGRDNKCNLDEPGEKDMDSKIHFKSLC